MLRWVLRIPSAGSRPSPVEQLTLGQQRGLRALAQARPGSGRPASGITVQNPNSRFSLIREPRADGTAARGPASPAPSGLRRGFTFSSAAPRTPSATAVHLTAQRGNPGQLIINKSRPGAASVPVQGSAPPAWGSSAPSAQPVPRRPVTPAATQRDSAPTPASVPPLEMANGRAQLDVPSLTVAKLREELKKRRLLSTGVKAVLAQRLTEALQAGRTHRKICEQ